MFLENYEDIVSFFEGLKPIPRLTVSQWADENRYLSSVSSAEPGKYRTDRTPYMRKIMDCLSSHETYKRIVFMKGAQVGASESANNFVGYVIDMCPSPIMIVQPTDGLAKRYSKTRIEPLIRDCPTLKEKVSENKSRDGENTILQKNFTGGVLMIVGANSAPGLRSAPVRILILDEVDAYPKDINGEGAPIDLAVARTKTFPNKKIFIISTPTIQGISAVEAEFEETDQNYYFVPCPHCGEMQRLVFAQLKWDEGKPETAQYCCIECGCLIEERFKVQMFSAGEWRPLLPEKSNYDTIGFHLNSLYSPYGWQSWAEIVHEFIKAQKDQAKLKTFVNTVLGETWVEKGEAPPYMNLYNRREDYRQNIIPDDVCFLTAGVDVQKDRIELEIVGWCSDKRSYSIDFRVIEGETSADLVWEKLAEVIDETWICEDGGEMRLKMTAIDSGYNTAKVYEFCRRFDSSRVIPTKGQDGLGMAVAPSRHVSVSKSGKKIGKVKIWHVGVSYLKSELYGHLRLEKNEGVPPPNYCHFPQYDEHYFRGLTAEELTLKYVKGYRKYEWVKRYERNEPLDCRIYARAAAVVIGIERLSELKIKHFRVSGGINKKRHSDSDIEKQNSNTKRKSRRAGSFWDR